MTNAIRREIVIPQPREQVWEALTDSCTLAEWMFPNDFAPVLGHRFTFQIPPNPKAGFEGLTVRCVVLECAPPDRLAFSWSAGGAVDNTQVSFHLEPDGEGTRVHFEHAGFDLSQPYGEQAFKGAEFGWARMLKQLAVVVADRTTDRAKPPDVPSAVISTGRLFSASPRQIFAAFERPEQLARWWGPRDFTNTFETFEFRPGGKWVFVMHAPNGASYPNESIFREIATDSRIVIEHIVAPWFRLTVTLTASGDQTHLAWDQEFESAEVAARFRPLSEMANEQNLDRLESLLSALSS